MCHTLSSSSTRNHRHQHHNHCYFRPGVKIVTKARGAYDLWLTDHIKHVGYIIYIFLHVYVLLMIYPYFEYIFFILYHWSNPHSTLTLCSDSSCIKQIKTSIKSANIFKTTSTCSPGNHPKSGFNRGELFAFPKRELWCPLWPQAKAYARQVGPNMMSKGQQIKLWQVCASN